MKVVLQSCVWFGLVYIGLMTNQAFAISAYPYPVEITQPDGTKITIIQKGDERVKWAQTVDGYSILRNRKGVFEYAMLGSTNDMIPSGIKAKNQTERSLTDNQFLSKTGKGIVYSKSQVGMMKSISTVSQKSVQKAFPTAGNRKLVCILIGFTDKAFTKTKSDFENLFNQVNYTADGATGSVNDYYKENSYGLLNLTVTVAGPYTAAHNMAYYGANDLSGNDINPEALITEAVTLANPDVDYTQFDNDNNGVVDGVYVIYAGYGEEYSGVSTDAIWAHASEISPLTLDGKIVSSYSCSSEFRGNSGTGITRIGVICHEFGHVMGASDFYDTDYAGSGGEFDGTGKWDLMADGSWNNNGATPAHHNPYTKIYVYNWATATTISTGSSITLNNAEQNSNSFYRINTTNSNEYFLIENRQKLLFDNGIPGHGMVIYHVDGNYITSNEGSINASNHQGLYPVCASATGNPPANYGSINDAGLPFPGINSKTQFTDTTTPSMLSWTGTTTNSPITNITENTTNKTITFDFMGGVPSAPTATTIAASGISATGVTLNAQINANNASTTVTFEYGTTTSYGSTVNGSPSILTGTTSTSITAVVTGLSANTTYNYRVKAVNSSGTTYGNNTTFLTKSFATINITNTTQEYNGSPRTVTVTTIPANLNVDITYDGSTTAPRNTGVYAVIATVNDANYQGQQTGTLTINKTTATITISNTTQPFDGTSKTVTILTSPFGITVDVTYAGSTLAPINVGTYAVVATVNDPNYLGTQTATLIITPITNVDPNSINNAKIYSNSKEILVEIPVLTDPAQLAIYNILGNKVYQNDNLTQGLNIVQEYLTSGVYIVKLVIGKKIITQKVVLQK